METNEMVQYEAPEVKVALVCVEKGYSESMETGDWH